MKISLLSLLLHHMMWIDRKNASFDWIKMGGSGPDIAQIKNATALIDYLPDGQRYFD